MKERFRLGYAEIDCMGRDDALFHIITAAQQSPCTYVVTPNSDHIVMLEDHVNLRAAYRTAHLVFADGMPLVWASRLLGPRLPERVTGADLLPLLCAKAAGSGLRVFLLGSAPGVAEIAKGRLEKQYPRLQICGCYSPPFGFDQSPEETTKILDILQEARAHIIFVGLGAPKQELWMAENAKRIEAGVMLGIGAAIDFCAGQVERAPRWMQGLGLEWVFRLWQEPRRLGGRYLRDTRILWIVLREWSRRHFSPRESA